MGRFVAVVAWSETSAPSHAASIVGGSNPVPATVKRRASMSDVNDRAEDSPFGTVFGPTIGIARWADGAWEPPQLTDLQPFSIHPAAHVLHYGSACFEGLKAHRGTDGTVRIFRLERHVDRLRTSAAVMVLPVPPVDLVTEMVVDVVRSCLDVVPEPPGSLYLRPTLIGTEANIGAAALPSSEATLFVLASPVGDYFAGGARPLSLAVETAQPRTTPQFGMVKSGANYAMALGTTRRAAQAHGADQVLFAPQGRLEETGASNVMLLDDTTVITPELTEAFLHGVTRDSILKIAADLGYDVHERPITIDDLLETAARPEGEVALSGTAAGLAPVGRLIHEDTSVSVGAEREGPNTLRLRRALAEIQTSTRPDRYGWLTPITT